MPKRTGFELPFLCCGGHITRKQMYVFQDYDYALRKGRCRLPPAGIRAARISCPLGISRLESRKEKFSKVFGHIIDPLY